MINRNFKYSIREVETYLISLYSLQKLGPSSFQTTALQALNMIYKYILSYDITEFK